MRVAQLHRPRDAKVGLIWDMAPCQANKKVDEWVAGESDWLTVAVIPCSLTSILQVGDLVANSQLKYALKAWVSKSRMKKMRESKDIGHLKLKLYPPELLDAMEDIIADFNQQLTNPTIDNCFRKVGQDISCSLKEFTEYLTSLSEEQIYRVLIDAHTAELVDLPLATE